MRKHLVYVLLISPLIPLAVLCWVFEKINKSKSLDRWESAARRAAYGPGKFK